MEKNEILAFIEHNIEYKDFSQIKNDLDRFGYEYKFISAMEPEAIRVSIQDKHPVIVLDHFIVGYDDTGLFKTSNYSQIPITRPVSALVLTGKTNRITPSPDETESTQGKELFLIMGTVDDEWKDAICKDSRFDNILAGLKIGSPYLPPHSAIVNFKVPTDQQKKDKIVSDLFGANINIYDKENFVDNCIHEIGHLFWRTRLTYEEKKAFSDLSKPIKKSAIFDYQWELSSEEEVFCTIYKWYMKGILFNPSFMNILAYEEPKGTAMIKDIVRRIASDQTVDDIWEHSHKDVIDYLSPKFDVNSGMLICKKSLADKVRDIEIPSRILKKVHSMDNGTVMIQLTKAKIIPVIGNKIDISKINFADPLSKGRFLHEGKPIVFVDMDGVVADFKGHYKECFGSEPKDSFTVIQNCQSRPNFFRELSVIDKGKALVELLQDKYTIVFLTTPMESMPSCRSDKVAWAKENFPEVKTVLFSSNKEEFAGSERSILIDDREEVLAPFRDAGGTAINSSLSNDKILALVDDAFNQTSEVAKIKKQLNDMDVDLEPTQAQKESGIYKKGRIQFKGMTLAIENPKGSIRFGFDGSGTKWVNRMNNHYGYIIQGYEGNDGDKIDCFLGPVLNSSRAFVVNQINPASGLFDEHKVMLGFSNIDDATAAYLSNYSKNWKGLGSIVQTNTKKLREWLESGKHTEPFGDAKDIIAPAASVLMNKASKLNKIQDFITRKFHV